MNLLDDLDPDEVSPVFRGANRKGVVLKGDSVNADAQVQDILSIPWDHEGAMVDALRHQEADEVVQKSAVAAMRLLNGITGELSPSLRETVEKLGREMYSRKNPPLNTGDGVGNGGELEAEDTSPEHLDGKATGAARDGKVKGPKRDGKGRGFPVNYSDDDDDDDDADDMGGAPDGDADDVEKAYYDMVEKDFTADQRREYARRGIALPDGSYPIPNREYLGRAIHALGRGTKNPKSKIKAHIMRRARALGAEEMIPETWQKTDAVAKAFRVLKSALAMSQDARPSTPDDPDDDDEPDDDLDDDNTVKKGGTVDHSTLPVPIKKEDGSWDLTNVPNDARPFFAEMIEKADRTAAELTEAREKLAKADDEIRMKEVVAKAEKMAFVAPTDELATVLKAASENLDADTFEKLENILKTANERVEKSNLFSEMGRSSLTGGDAAGDAWAQIEKAALDMVEKSDSPIDQSAAIDKFLSTPAGAELYSKYLAENSMGVK